VPEEHAISSFPHTQRVTTRASDLQLHGEGEHDEPSVEEPSGTVNVRVPTEQTLSGSHHSVIPQVGQETPVRARKRC
jgi:hypothetical protein